MQLEQELREKENQYLELYEEFNMLNDDMHELQQALEDAGYFDQAEEETEEKSRFAQLLGGAKMKGMFNKTRKVLKWGKSKADEKETIQEEEAKNGSSPTQDKPQEVKVLHQETKPSSPKIAEPAIQATPFQTDSIPVETPTEPKKDIKEILQDIKNEKTEAPADKKKSKDKQAATDENDKLRKQNEELNNKIKELNKQQVLQNQRAVDQEKELMHFKELTNELANKVHESELREQEYESIFNAKNFEIKEKENEIARVEAERDKCMEEIDEFNNQLMKMKDERMDQEASEEKRYEKERIMKEEIVLLKGTVQGKDQAI